MAWAKNLPIEYARRLRTVPEEERCEVAIKTGPRQGMRCRGHRVDIRLLGTRRVIVCGYHQFGVIEMPSKEPPRGR